MFLDYWLSRLMHDGGWSVFLLVTVLAGVIVGIYFMRYRRFFYLFSSFWVAWISLMLFFSGYTPFVWERYLLLRPLWAADSVRYVLVLLLALGVAFFSIALRRGEILGRFFASFLLFLNFFYLLIWLSNWVEILLFLETFPFQILLFVAFIAALAAIAWREIPALLSALLGSSLLVVVYMQVLQRIGEHDTFFGQSPFVLFVFLVLAVLMKATQGSS